MKTSASMLSVKFSIFVTSPFLADCKGAEPGQPVPANKEALFLEVWGSISLGFCISALKHSSIGFDRHY